MEKRCRAFNSETKSAYVKHKLEPQKASSAKLYWGDENKIEVKLDKEAESLIKKLILDRYKTIYQRYYNSERFEAALNQEEIDLGNELVEYLKKLYHTPPVVQMSRLPYTSTRLFGFSNPKFLVTPFSDYQDTTGRTGEEIIFNNLKKIMVSKLKSKIHEKLRTNRSDWEKDLKFPDGNQFT